MNQTNTSEIDELRSKCMTLWSDVSKLSKKLKISQLNVQNITFPDHAESRETSTNIHQEELDRLKQTRKWECKHIRKAWISKLTNLYIKI